MCLSSDLFVTLQVKYVEFLLVRNIVGYIFHKTDEFKLNLGHQKIQSNIH